MENYVPVEPLTIFDQALPWRGGKNDTHSDWPQAQQQRQKIRVTKHLGMIVCDSVVSAKI
jgi:hypothetical protein